MKGHERKKLAAALTSWEELIDASVRLTGIYDEHTV